MTTLRALFVAVFGWIVAKVTRRKVERELQQKAERDQLYRRTAAEIVAAHADEKTRQEAEKVTRLDEQKKLELLRRRFGRDRQSF